MSDKLQAHYERWKAELDALATPEEKIALISVTTSHCLAEMAAEMQRDPEPLAELLHARVLARFAEIRQLYRAAMRRGGSG